MGVIKITQKGDFSNTEKFLEKLKGIFHKSKFDKYGQWGVQALSANTPVESGLTASSWYYEVSNTSSGVSITWLNRNVNKGVPIAIILQYGHGTGTGGYVQGRDYINPALKPVFDRIEQDFLEEVTKL